MKEITESLLSKLNPIIPLDMQLANNIVELCHIKLIRNIETGILIPHYYSGEKYTEDKNWEKIEGFIKNEIFALFSYCLQPEEFIDVKEDLGRFSFYRVPENFIKNYQKDVGFINRLTKNVVGNIKTISSIVKEESEFDVDPYKINTLNGILNLKTGRLSPHTPDILIKNIVNAKYCDNIADRNGQNVIIKKPLPQAVSKIINEALYDNKLNDKENREIVNSFIEILASFLIGNNIHKLIFILIGKPNTGKSTLLRMLKNIFGLYGCTFNNSALFMSSRTNNDIRPDIIDLRDKRILLGSESNKKEKFDVALLKALSGNDEISFRKPHKGDMINFTLKGKIMLATNFCPTFSSLDDTAFVNRIVIIDFKNTPQNIDAKLENQILNQDCYDIVFTYLAIFANIIVNNNKIFIHERFRANKQRILVNQNSSVSLFWNAHIRPCKEYPLFINMWMKHPVKPLYSIMYCDFCHRIGVTPLSLEAFAKEFKSITDEYPLVMWKKGESNNFYRGFDVVDGQAPHYYRLVYNNNFDLSVTNENQRLYS